FIGASSYYLYTYADDDRAAVLDAMQSAGMTVIRIFISAVAANNKGSNNQAVNDVEIDNIGTYDDTVLTQVDQLMLEASQRGMKLLIALHDRYALGFWSTDVYCTQLGISGFTNNPPQIADASAFYTNDWAASMFDQRMTHILNHQNAQMGNTAWKDLDSGIYGFEPQNEPQGHMDLVAPNWVCDRASTLAGLIPAGSSILISSGGGIDADSSVGDWAFGCGEIDVVAVHDYNLGSDFLSTIQNANNQAKSQGRVSVVGEWGVMGDDKESKAQTIVDALKGDGISWLYWEVTKPGAGSSNFEVWTDEPTWDVLASGS
ncbi:glycoside hydrolase family 5 protein, partial [Calocera cornea HHB12733]